jgi:hypothetical protein
MHVPLAGQQDQLRLGKLGIDHRQRQAVESEVPGGEPRILPLVRHRQDFGTGDMLPVVIAAVFSCRRRLRLAGIAVQPFVHVVMKKLLAPDHPGESLALHEALVGVVDLALQVGVELIGVVASLGEDGIKVGEGRRGFSTCRARRQSQPHTHAAARGHAQ